MGKRRFDLVYQEEFAKPGEGPGNARLLVDCMWAVFGLDPKVVNRQVTREEREKNRDRDLVEEIRKLVAGI